MSLSLEIQEIVDCLDDKKKLLVLEIVKNFLPEDEVFEGDLELIELAEKEYHAGETISHSERDWR